MQSAKIIVSVELVTVAESIKSSSKYVVIVQFENAQIYFAKVAKWKCDQLGRL